MKAIKDFCGDSYKIYFWSCKYGKHMIGLPTIEYDIGYSFWYFNNKLHRINGIVSNYGFVFVNNLYSQPIIINVSKLVI